MASCGIYEALWLARLHQASAGALYLHVPFCARKCAYCDFASRATRADDPVMTAYEAALERQLAEAGEAGLLDSCATAYIGGGTPTLLGPSVAGLVRALSEVAPRIGELTCEANPESLTDEVLDALADAGCTRLSIGVQSLHDDELRFLGRIHTAARARERVAAAVDHGFHVSCDVMCALEGQSAESFEETLRGLLACGIGHLSVYPLQIEEGTELDRRIGDDEPSWHDTSVQADLMARARTLLEAEGLQRYEVASYARRGRACAHNQAYWTGVPYLGLGTSASSMLTREGYLRLRGVIPSLPEPGENVRRVRLTCTNTAEQIARDPRLPSLRFDLELLDERQAAAEDLMLGMRLAEGIGIGLLEHARACLGHQAVDEALEQCEARGLVERTGPSWKPTDQGWLLGNELYGEMWDLAPEGVASA